MSATYWVVAAIVLGTVLLVVEVLIIPGIGVAGVIAAIALIGGCVIAFSQLGPLAGALALGGGLTATILMLWLLPKTRAARNMVLDEQHTSNVADATLQALAGKVGVALTPLRPAGSARIDDRPRDVVSDGEYIEKGTTIRVARVEGTRAIVERLPEPGIGESRG